MQQVQDKSNKAESETQRQRVVIEEQARLIKELSQRLSEPTAPPAITAGSIASYRTAVPAWSDRNADGACRAASSEELLPESAGGPTDTHQSVFRHQRGRANPQLSAGDLYPRSGFQTLLSGSGHGNRAPDARNLTTEPEILTFSGVAHKGSDLKVSKGSSFSFITGNDINGASYSRYAEGPRSGSGIAKPALPAKHFTALKADTPGIQCGRVHTGGDCSHSSAADPNTQTPRCEQSVYTPGFRKEHPGHASGSGRLSHPVSSSETANTSPGVPAFPGTPLSACYPGGNGRFGHDHPPTIAAPPDQRTETAECNQAASSRAPSHLAFHPPKAQDAARFAAATSGPTAAPNLTETDESSNLTPQSLQQARPGLVTRLAKAVVSNIPFMRTTPCTTPTWRNCIRDG